MKNSIVVSNIRTSKYNAGEIVITFNDNATMYIDSNNLQVIDKEVYTEKRTLKSERLTKKYFEAFENYLSFSKVDSITHENNEKKVVYKVYQIGKKIIAHKVDFLTSRVLAWYDWTSEGDIQKIADSYRSDRHTGHYKYEFYVLSQDMEKETAKNITRDISKVVNMSVFDMENLATTIHNGIKKHGILYAYIVDSSNSIHMVFKTSQNMRDSFIVLSCYNNGLGDRTTYNGLYRGSYDIENYEDADFNIIKRCEGMAKLKDLAF